MYNSLTILKLACILEVPYTPESARARVGHTESIVLWIEEDAIAKQAVIVAVIMHSIIITDDREVDEIITLASQPMRRNADTRYLNRAKQRNFMQRSDLIAVVPTSKKREKKHLALDSGKNSPSKRHRENTSPDRAVDLTKKGLEALQGLTAST